MAASNKTTKQQVQARVWRGVTLCSLLVGHERRTAVKSSMVVSVISLWATHPQASKAGAGRTVAAFIAQLFTTEWDSSQLSKVKASQAYTLKDGWINEIGAGCKRISLNLKGKHADIIHNSN